MSAKKQFTESPAEEVVQKKADLKPYNVVIDGHDRTIMAVDEKDLQEQITKIRSSKLA